MSQDRNDLEFKVYVSFNVEKMTEALNGRAERFCAFLLILLGSAVFADVSSPFALGVAVASIAALQFVCRFGEAAGSAKAQKHRYSGLLGRMSFLDDDELQSCIDRIEEFDTRTTSFIEVIAYNKACQMRGQECAMRPLPTSTWLMAFIVGGRPCGHRAGKESKPSAH